MSKVQLLTPRQVEDEYGTVLSVRKLKYWREKGVGPPYQKLEGSICYDRETLLEWIAAGTKGSEGSGRSSG